MNTNVNWIFLIGAGFFEIGWPLGLKLSNEPGMRILGIVIATICMAVSGILLLLALKGIPIGTAYAVWTGIGAVGTFVVGVLFFGDAGLILRWIGVCLIMGGVVCLKLA